MQTYGCQLLYGAFLATIEVCKTNSSRWFRVDPQDRNHATNRPCPWKSSRQCDIKSYVLVQESYVTNTMRIGAEALAEM